MHGLHAILNISISRVVWICKTIGKLPWRHIAIAEFIYTLNNNIILESVFSSVVGSIDEL